MTEKEQELFYIGAALFLDLDSTGVDNVLANAGLSAKSDPVAACRRAIRTHFPERYEFVHGMRPVFYLSPTLLDPGIQK